MIGNVNSHNAFVREHGQFRLGNEVENDKRENWYEEAYGVINEEIYVAEAHSDYDYADYLKEIRELLPKVWDDIQRNYPKDEAGEVFYYYVNDAISAVRAYVRGIERKPKYHYFPPEVVLKHIVEFSRQRGYRYGVNIEYIANNLRMSDFVAKEHVRLLKRKGLVFFKRWKGHTYVLPTKKARKIYDPESVWN